MFFIRFPNVIVSSGTINKLARLRFLSIISCLVFAGGLSCTTVPEVIMDIDGNVYHTVTIGDQVWMTENLRTTRYRNGDSITFLPDGGQWSNSSEGAYCNYNNNASIGAVDGRLYNWYAISDSRNIAPEGWRIPTRDDWARLIGHLGGDTIAGRRMKANSEWWLHPNSATDESGFNALPTGYRYSPGGTFHTRGSNAYWWSTTGTIQLYTWTPRVYEDFADIEREHYYKMYGFALRCVKE